MFSYIWVTAVIVHLVPSRLLFSDSLPEVYFFLSSLLCRAENKDLSYDTGTIRAKGLTFSPLL